MNVGNPGHKNTMSGWVLCHHDRGMSAKSADIWLLGRHVANMSATFPAKLSCSASFLDCSLVICPCCLIELPNVDVVDVDAELDAEYCEVLICDAMLGAGGGR